MRIDLGPYEYTGVWEGVLTKALSDYPRATDWEKRTIVEFIEYEAANGRSCELCCENKDTLAEFHAALSDRERYRNVPRPALLTECRACPVRKGCSTQFVCHTASPENAASILRCGSILSAVRARNLPAKVLAAEPRNAAKDPEDYFDYVMFTWGNCQAGDRLVMERKLGRFPDEDDLSVRLTPGVRFYFRYDDIVRHPDAVFDGVLPLKIRDGVALKDWLYAMIVPEELRTQIDPLIPQELAGRTVYVENDCKDVWEWSEKVCRIVENLSQI